jgi:predicted dithiol-disulfide oxidoreductase (DUF899 family)
MLNTIVTHEEWLQARTGLLAREKELTRHRDEIAAARRALPWEEVRTDYVFTGAEGPATLADLFAGKPQLIVYHFMFPADWEAGCPHCSFWADSFDPNVVHLAANEVTLVAVSIAPIEKLEAYRRRMGWGFRWLSSAGTSFNRDFGVTLTEEDVARGATYNYTSTPARPTEREGMSVFYRSDDGRIFHTYSAYARGIDLLNAAYNYLDTVPLGRREDGEGRHNQWWVRRHDEYGAS